MASQFSDVSRQSINSTALFKSAYSLNENKLYKLIDNIDDDTMHKIWGGLGLHIARQMRMGRGVLIHKFGSFTFGPTEFNKEGFASEKLREKQSRQPVFLVSGEFIKGMGLKQGIYSELSQSIRPYGLVTSGQIQQSVINYNEISNLIQIDPHKCKAGISRMLSSLAVKINQSGQADLEIPGIGYFIVRNQLCAVNFYPSFVQSTQNSPNLPLDERKEKGEMTLTAANLNILEYRNNFSSLSPEKSKLNKSTIEVASSVNSYLQNSLGINLQQLIDQQKKQTQADDTISTNQQRQENMGEKSISQRSFVPRSLVIRDLSSGHKNHPKTAASQRSFKTSTSMASDIFNKGLPLHQRIIQFWMRQNHLDTERGFIRFCESTVNTRNNFQFIKLDSNQFKQCVESNEIKLAPELIEDAFKQLDERSKNFIDYVDWQRVFGEYLPSQIKHLDYIRDVIFKKGLRTDDILKTMRLTRDSQPLNKNNLIECIILMCGSLSQQKADKIADVLLSITGSSTITVQQLTKQLQSVEEDDKEHDPTWFKNLLWRLKLKFSSQSLLQDMKEKFTNYDEHNEGFLDVASFKICLIKSQLKLSISEVNRMIRYIEKDSKERIDYFKFLEQISSIETTRVPQERIFDRNDFISKLKNYYHKFENSNSFLKHVNKNVKLNEDVSTNLKVTFAKLAIYLRNFLFQDETAEYLESFIKQIDFGKDGLIDVYDIEQFVKNGKYIDQVAALSETIKQNPLQTIKYLPVEYYDSKKILGITKGDSGGVTSNNNFTYKFTTNSTLKQNENGEIFEDKNPPSYPINPLSEDKINLILRDLRKNISERQITFRHLFDLLDTDKNGMVSCSEFMENIDKFIQLSQPVKDGFFAYIDKLHIGMIDVNSFLKVLSKSVVDNGQGDVTEDNWVWQNVMIQKLYKWYVKGNFSSEEEAFRALDFEYKGYIDSSDLKKFLRDVLKEKEKELTEARINRLFKIIDFYKSGRIGMIDFIKFIQQQREMQIVVNNTKLLSKESDDTLSMKRSSSTQHSRTIKPKTSRQQNGQLQIEILNVDWKKSAQQQIGLFISKNYDSIATNFDTVSQYKNKITYENFSKWIEQSNAVHGFDLTQTLLQELYAYFDPHKKGFLTESDWSNAFGHINWRKQMVEELKNLIDLHFGRNSQLKEGFEFFLAKNDRTDQTSESLKVITLSGFYNGINYLYPGRFKLSEINEVWDKELNYLLKPGMDYNMFLGFLKKTLISSHLNPRSERAGKMNGQQSLIFSSQQQQQHAKQIDLFDKEESNKFRSFTPIAVAGSRVSQSPKSRIRGSESLTKYASSITKQHSPVKLTMSDTKRGDRVDPIAMNGKSSLLLLKPGSFFQDKGNSNERYNSHTKVNSASTNYRINSTFGQQNGPNSLSILSPVPMQHQGDFIIQKVKRILRSSYSQNLEDILRKYDESASGFLTNLQFKKAINELNLGLKNQEISFLLNICGLDGRVEIKKILLLLQISEEDQLIVKRCNTKLKQVASQIYTYMISPVDAFRQFNSSGNGKMNLYEFEALIKQLAVLSREPQESFTVLKDMFGFLDRNQDGYIDYREWNDVISNLMTSQFHFGRVPADQNDSKGKGESDSNPKKYRSLSSIINVKEQHSQSFVKVNSLLQQSMSEKKEPKDTSQNQESAERRNSSERSTIFRINSKLSQISGRERQLSANKLKSRDNLEVKDHDVILHALARNRKYLMDLFHSYNTANIAITYELAKSLIMNILNSQGIKLSDQNAYQFIKFAERDGIVDYKLLLDVYKDRLQASSQMVKK